MKYVWDNYNLKWHFKNSQLEKSRPSQFWGIYGRGVKKTQGSDDIIDKQPIKYASREGLAAYGYEGYFKVSSVMTVTALLDSKSKRRQQEQKSGGQGMFERLLADESERLREERSLEGKMIGYAKNGQVFIGQTLQREYR